MSSASLGAADPPGPATGAPIWTVEPAEDNRAHLGVVALPESYPATPQPPKVSSSATTGRATVRCGRIICAATVVLLVFIGVGTTLGTLPYRGSRPQNQSSHGDYNQSSLQSITAQPSAQLLSGRGQEGKSRAHFGNPWAEVKLSPLTPSVGEVSEVSSLSHNESSGWVAMSGASPPREEQDRAARLRQRSGVRRGTW